jgi:AbrB family looped-hinge helix DNA binding protein
MPTATVTSKGQVTIPKAIREVLGLKTGDSITFELVDEGRVEMRPRTVDLRSLAGMVRPKRTGVSLHDMEDAIAEGAAASVRGEG